MSSKKYFGILDQTFILRLHIVYNLRKEGLQYSVLELEMSEIELKISIPIF